MKITSEKAIQCITFKRVASTAIRYDNQAETIRLRVLTQSIRYSVYVALMKKYK